MDGVGGEQRKLWFEERSAPVPFGKFLLLRRLGSGGMAEVFRAVQRGAQGYQRVVVVKRLLPASRGNPELVRMFADEARICARLSHPNIVHVHEFGTVGDEQYLSMEYVPGCTLAELQAASTRSRQPVDPRLAAHIALQVCRALECAHGSTTDGRPSPIVHRDIAPPNIMLTADGTVKVLDFGIARAPDRRETTRNGIVKGRIGYLAPEQVGENVLDHRVDIFALGIVLFELLAGRRLFDAESDLGRLQALISQPIRPMEKLATTVTTDLQRIVTRALQREPARRYATAADMGAVLEDYLHTHRTTSRIIWNAIQACAGDVLNATEGVELTASERFSATWVEQEATPLPPAAPPRRIGRVLAAAAIVTVLAVATTLVLRRADARVVTAPVTVPAPVAVTEAPESTPAVTPSAPPPAAEPPRGEAAPASVVATIEPPPAAARPRPRVHARPAARARAVAAPSLAGQDDDDDEDDDEGDDPGEEDPGR